jgi:hypothetical protein
MTNEHITASEKPPMGKEPTDTGDQTSNEQPKPMIVAGSGRGGLSGGADPGSTGAGIAGSDVGVAGISGKATTTERDPSDPAKPQP